VPINDTTSHKNTGINETRSQQTSYCESLVTPTKANISGLPVME